VPESSELSTMTTTKYLPKEVALRISPNHSSRSYWTLQQYQRPPTLMTNESFGKWGFKADVQSKPKLKTQTQTRQPLALNLYTPCPTHVHLHFYIPIFRIEIPSSSLLLIAYHPSPLLPYIQDPRRHKPSRKEERAPQTRPTQKYGTSWVYRSRGCRKNGRVGATSRRSTLPVGGARVRRPGMWIARGNRTKKTKEKGFSSLLRWLHNHVRDPSPLHNAAKVSPPRSYHPQ
jgi:hypothetical protein